MPLTTVARGRVFDWSHAVGRGAARGTGYNYIQTMCLGKNGALYATNRGNENNFGMHANKVQLGGPGEEVLANQVAVGLDQLVQAAEEDALLLPLTLELTCLRAAIQGGGAASELDALSKQWPNSLACASG